MSNRILRCDKPADLSVQAPTKYETVINMKTAMAFCGRPAEICSPRDFLRMDAKRIWSPAAGYEARLQHRLTD